MTSLKKLKFIALIVLLAYGVTGCTVIRHEASSADSTKIAFGPSLDGSKPVVRTFETTGRATYWLLYLIQKNKLNGYDLAKRQLSEGEALQNLQIETKYDVVDFFVSFIGLVFGTRRIDVKGEIVKA